MTDHVLLVGHRSITRVLLAYFQGLKREDISDLDVPLGVVYMLEPVSRLLGALVAFKLTMTDLETLRCRIQSLPVQSNPGSI